jgi:hypothetical protein
MNKKALLVGTLAASLLITSCSKTATGSTTTRVTAIERLAGINASVTAHDFALPSSVTINSACGAPTEENPSTFCKYDSGSHYFYSKSSSTDSNVEDSSAESSSAASVEKWEYVINQLTILTATDNKGTKTFAEAAYADYASVTSAWKADTNDTLDAIYETATETSGTFLELLNELNNGSYSSGKETYASTGEGNLSITTASLSNQSTSAISGLDGSDSAGAKFDDNLPVFISLSNSGKGTETDKTISWNECDETYPTLSGYDQVSSSR